jgi:hypothetical protein
VLQFRQGRRSPPVRRCRALKCSSLVAKAQRPDPTAVVHGEEEVDGVELWAILTR